MRHFGKLAWLLAIVALVACRDSHQDETHKRGEESLILLLTPEPLYASNPVVEDVVQRLTDFGTTTGFSVRTTSPHAGEYDTQLREMLDTRYTQRSGDLLLIAIDNNMQLSLYETDKDGQLQRTEHHRLELFGTGYLCGLCAGMDDAKTLVLQGETNEAANDRYGEGFLVGYKVMLSTTTAEVRKGHYDDPEELFDLANEEGWDLIITNYGIAEPWDGMQSTTFDIQIDYSRLIEEYLESWRQSQKRNQAPEEVISLKSGYITVAAEGWISEVIEIHWQEAIELEEQYVTPYLPVRP